MELNNEVEPQVSEVEPTQQNQSMGNPPGKGLKALIKDAYNAVGYDIDSGNIDKVYLKYTTAPEKFVKDFWAENNTELPDDVMKNIQTQYLQTAPMKFTNVNPNNPTDSRPARTIPIQQVKPKEFPQIVLPAQQLKSKGANASEIYTGGDVNKPTDFKSNINPFNHKPSIVDGLNNSLIDYHFDQAKQEEQAQKEIEKTRTPLEKVEQFLKLPSLNHGFYDLAAAGTTAIDDVMGKIHDVFSDKPYESQKGGLFDKLKAQTDYDYEHRDKPSSIGGHIAEGIAETIPTIIGAVASDGVTIPGAIDYYAGKTAANASAMLSPQTTPIINHFVKYMFTTGGVKGYGASREAGNDISTSVKEGYKGAIEGGYEGLKIEALGLLGGAFGEHVADKIAKVLPKTAKNVLPVLKAAGVGLAFGAGSAGGDLLDGKPIDEDNVLTQLGVGAAFGAHDIYNETKDVAGEHFTKWKLNDAIKQSVMQSRGAARVRTLFTIPVESIQSILDMPGNSSDIQVKSLQAGINAVESKDVSEKARGQIAQLGLQNAADLKGVAEQIEHDKQGVIKSVENSEMPDESKQLAIQKIEQIDQAQKASKSKRGKKQNSNPKIGDVVTDKSGKEHQVFGYTDNGLLNEYGNEVTNDNIAPSNEVPVVKQDAGVIDSPNVTGAEHITNPLNESLSKLGYSEGEYAKLDDSQKQHLIENEVKKPDVQPEEATVENKSKDILGKMGIEVPEPKVDNNDSAPKDDVKEDNGSEILADDVHFSRPQVANILRTKPEGLIDESTLDDKGKKDLSDKKQKIQFVLKKKFNDLTKSSQSDFEPAVKKLVYDVMNYRRRNLIKGEKAYTEKGFKDDFYGMGHWIDSIEGAVAARITGGRGRAQEIVQRAQSDWAKEIDQNERGGKLYKERLTELGRSVDNQTTPPEPIDKPDIQEQLIEENTSPVNDKEQQSEQPLHTVEADQPEADEYYKADEEPASQESPKDVDIKDEIDTRRVQVGEDHNGKPIVVRAEDLPEYNKTIELINKKLARIDAGESKDPDAETQIINKLKGKLKELVANTPKPSKAVIEKDVAQNKTVVKNLNIQKANIEASTLIERAELLANKLDESANKKLASVRKSGGLSSNGLTNELFEGTAEKIASHLIRNGVKVIKGLDSIKKIVIELINKKVLKGDEFDLMTKAQKKNIVKIINGHLENHFGGEEKTAERSKEFLDNNKSEAKKINDSKGGLTPFERFRRNFTDRSAKLTENLKKQGNKKIDSSSPISETYGEKAIRLFNAMSGSGNKADEMYRAAYKEIFGNPLIGGKRFINQGEQRVLSLIINMKRISEIDRLRMQRNPDKELALHPGGYSYLLAEKTLSDLENKTPAMVNTHGDYDFADLSDRADKYFDVMQRLLDLRYENGLISDASYKTMKEAKYYSPRKFMQYINNDLNFKTKSVVVGNAVKSLGEGSDQAYIDNPAYLMADAIGLVHRDIDKNKTFRAFNELLTTIDTEMGRPAKYSGEFMKKLREHYDKKEAAATPTVNLLGVENAIEDTDWKYISPSFETPGEGETLFKYYDKGVQKAFIMKDVYAAELEGFKPRFNRQALALWSGGRLKQTLATGINAYFAVSNTIRDAGYILFTTNHYSPVFPVAAAQYSKDWVSALKEAWTKGQKYQDFLKEGGGREFLSDAGDLYAGSESQLKGAVNELWYYLGHKLPQTSEIAGRLAVRSRVLKNLTDQYKSSGKEITPEIQKEIQERASFEAANTMDFSQGGIISKDINAAIPFLNAGILGTRNLFRYAKENPKMFGVKLLQLAAANSALALWNHGLIGDDDKESLERADYYRRFISANDKSVNHIIMLPFKYTDKGTTRYLYIKIPKPQEQKLFSGLFEHLALKSRGIDDNYIRERGKMDASSLMSYLPDGGNFLPPVISPFVGYMSNHDFFRDEAYYKGKTKVLPQDEYSDRTPMSYRRIGAALNMSPDRLKGAFESAIPTNNQIFDLVNFTADHLSLGSRDYYRDQEGKSTWLDQLGSVSKHMPEEDKDELHRFISETLHNLPGAKRLIGLTTTTPIDEDREDIVMKVNSEKKRLNFEMLDYIKRYQNNEYSDKKISEAELFKAAQDIGSNKDLGADGTTDVVRLIEMAKSAVKGKGASQFAKDLRWVDNDPEVQARDFNQLMKNVPDPEERAKYLRQIEESNMFSGRFFQELEKIQQSDKK